MKRACADLMQRVWYGSHPLRYLLLPLSLLTAVVVRFRRARRQRASPAPLPVIVVGNLTVGGTGKTPLVAAIVRHLQSRGYRPGIVSRGYGARRRSYPHWVRSDDNAGEVGDEPLWLRWKTACPVVIDPDRRRAVDALAGGNDAEPAAGGDINLAICDDGLQHYRLHRDLEIAVVDGHRRFGNGLLLPAGPLREPRARLEQVDLVVVAGTQTEAGGGEVASEGEFAMRLEPCVFENLVTGKRLAPDEFAGCTVHACAGIARPQRFFDTLEQLGAVVHAHAYPDHHRYRARDLCFEPGTPIIVTEKDAVKCRRFATDNMWSLHVEAVPEAAFWQALDRHLEKMFMPTKRPTKKPTKRPTRKPAGKQRPNRKK